MGHIQQGDQRQYFSNHQADVDTSGQVINALNQGLQSGVSLIQKANESTMASNQIDLSTKYLAINNEINTKYQADPTNPQREIELQQAFESLANQYKINPLCQKQWADIKTNVYDRYKTYNAQWSLQQQQSNIHGNLKNGYENLVNQISMMGQNGSSIDEVRLIYANGIEGLRNGAVAGLGEVVVNDFLKDANHDVMATYISALAMNNPLEAQKLLKDEGVRNDIGRADTLEKLDNYVANSLTNQSKRTAVAELGNTLRAMNSDEANNILDGKADLNKVMKFISSNKNLPEGSKDLILGIYGIRTKSDYYYDRDKKIITNKGEGGSGGGRSSGGSGRIPVKKMTSDQKEYYGQLLENQLHSLVSFSEDKAGNLNVKDIKKSKSQKEAQQGLFLYMNKVAEMQGHIDAAASSGVITKAERNRLTNSYIKPVTDYLESNLSQLDESTFLGKGKTKLGYDRVAKQFSTEGLKKQADILEINKQKLFAQNYYLDELNKVVAKIPNMKSVYDIESLPSGQQQEIYKTASENAIRRAKRWTDNPKFFFAKEYPTVYSEPFTYFPNKQAAQINNIVAEAVYDMEFKNPDGTSKIQLLDFAKNKMIQEINNTAKKNRIKAGDTMGVLRETRATISRPEPKNINEFYARVKALGVSVDDFMKAAQKRGYLEQNNFRHYEFLRELEHAKALKDRK